MGCSSETNIYICYDVKYTCSGNVEYKIALRHRNTSKAIVLAPEEKLREEITCIIYSRNTYMAVPIS